MCKQATTLQYWTKAELMSSGFDQITAGGGTIDFVQDHGPQHLSLTAPATPDFAGEYVASRVSEVNGDGKCWKPTDNTSVVAEYELRFAQASAPGLTETAFFWNAPFAGGQALPVTAVGVARSALTQGQYQAVIAQDLVMAPFSGLMLTASMPKWLDPTEWHSVRIMIATEEAQVEVKQGNRAYTSVLRTALLHAPEALGLEFSVDNELFPGTYGPVIAPDTLHIGALSIRSERDQQLLAA